MRPALELGTPGSAARAGKHDLRLPSALPMWLERMPSTSKARSLNILKQTYQSCMDAFWQFNADDGWAIASHIALSSLMAMFPFFLVLTALAGVFGSQYLADEAASLVLEAWPRKSPAQSRAKSITCWSAHMGRS